MSDAKAQVLWAIATLQDYRYHPDVSQWEIVQDNPWAQANLFLWYDIILDWLLSGTAIFIFIKRSNSFSSGRSDGIASGAFIQNGTYDISVGGDVSLGKSGCVCGKKV